MSLEKFHKSTVAELLAVTDRVRNLIPHWGEDGRYKEAVLKSVIKKFLPEQFSIGTGFVVKQTNSRNIHESSKQIDLIIYNTSFTVLFKEDDFVILTPDAVNGIIEVKANLENQGFKGVLKKAVENGKFIFKYKVNYPFFNGIFSYDGYNDISDFTTIKKAITELTKEFKTDRYFNNYFTNHISFNKNIFYKYWEKEPIKNKIYRTEDLSFAFFISNPIDCVSVNSVINNNQLWFPIDKDLNIIERF